MNRSQPARAVALALVAILLASAGWGQGATVYFTPFGSDDVFQDPVYQATELPVANAAAISLRREGPLSQPAVVRYWTEDGSAIEGQDYQRVTGTHTFQPGLLSDQVLIQVPLIIDADPEATETLLFHVVVTGGATLQGASTATVQILDDDRATVTPTVSFDVAGVRRNQVGDYVFIGAGAKIPIRVDGPAGQPVTVQIRSWCAPDDALLFYGLNCFFGRGNEVFTSVQVPSPGRVVWKAPGPIMPATALVRHEILSADTAEISNVASVLALSPREPDVDANSLAASCVHCDALFVRYDARFDSVCPRCDATCQRLPYPAPAQPRSVGRSEASSHRLESLDVLRSLRDGAMRESPAGRYYTRLYEGLSDSLFDAFLAEPRLFFDTFEVQDAWLEGLDALNEERGGTVTITAEMVSDLTGILQALEENGGPALRAVIEMEEERLDVATLAGKTFDELRETVEATGGGFDCTEDDETLCVNGGRFWIQVEWTDFQGNSGSGRAVPLTDDTGAFWFFDEANIELVIKVLDGTAINDSFWVFYGSLSNVEYEITVLDTHTGRVARYENPPGTFGSRGDVDAIPTDAAVAAGVTASTPSGLTPRAALGKVASATWDRVKDGWRRLWPSTPAVDVAALGSKAASPSSATGARGSCAPSATRLCLNGDRFAVEVSWTDFQGGSGAGQAAPLTEDTGTFWFFDEANVELVIKVLDGTAVNGRHWVFYGALSNVEYEITVTDTATGAVKAYANPQGEFGSLGDTDAF